MLQNHRYNHLGKYQTFQQKTRVLLFSDGGESQRPGVPPSYSYDSMPDADSIPAYGLPSYSSDRRREKRELVPGYGQPSVQSKCIEPPRIVHDIFSEWFILCFYTV